ncbi:hypothetical protein [Gracilibacillus dipsosauri]|uniref:Uncharacterized protein n=1 Tax=Gracilibacillus dipsosauri TaxID=178340 RepID=A0A317L0T8_9BACI|nr:hypothetical protein [Gracilibacillus dipsosauri]PWU69437.1 hypothetical protein DLJ74_05540 [Gracilibacillus dipsosauri]
MKRYILSLVLFVMIGAFTILRAMGVYVFLGYVLGVMIVHIGIYKRKILLILLGIVIAILSYLVPSFLGALFRFTE